MAKEEGIVGYGAYIPRWRIKASEIAEVWGADKERIRILAGEKAVGGPDEDSTTMAVEASRQSLLRAGINPNKIYAIYVGSESHPYVVKSTSSIIAEAIGATPLSSCLEAVDGFPGNTDAGKFQHPLMVGFRVLVPDKRKAAQHSGRGQCER